MQPVFETEHSLVGTLEMNDAITLKSYLRNNVEHHKLWEPAREEAYYDLSSVACRTQHNTNQKNEGSALTLAAINHDQTELLALCNFSNITGGVFLACNLGFSISKQHEGRGLMFEILSASINHVFVARLV